MQPGTAQRLVEELQRHIMAGPGVNLPVLERVREIHALLLWDEACDADLAELVTRSRKRFAGWLSQERGCVHGDDPQKFRSLLEFDLQQLRDAVAAPLDPLPRAKAPQGAISEQPGEAS